MMFTETKINSLLEFILVKQCISMLGYDNQHWCISCRFIYPSDLINSSEQDTCHQHNFLALASLHTKMACYVVSTKLDLLIGFICSLQCAIRNNSVHLSQRLQTRHWRSDIVVVKRECTVHEISDWPPNRWTRKKGHCITCNAFNTANTFDKLEKSTNVTPPFSPILINIPFNSSTVCFHILGSYTFRLPGSLVTRTNSFRHLHLPKLTYTNTTPNLCLKQFWNKKKLNWNSKRHTTSFHKC